MNKYLGKVRIAISVCGGVVAVLLVALWVRSYWRLQILETRIGLQAVQISSVKDHFAIASVDASAGIGRSYLSVASVNAADWRKRGAAGFAYYRDGTVTAVIVTHWRAALLAATVATVLWIPWRFSLRTLLIATTFVAVGLGGVAWLNH